MSSPTEERYSLDSFYARTVRLTVEGKEYRIDAHFLARDSPVLREMFDAPYESDDLDDHTPVYTLEGITKEELENLLWFYYTFPTYYRIAHQNVWCNILKLAELWKMDEVEHEALNHLNNAKLDTIEKIKLCERKYLGRGEARDAYVEICTRKEPLSAEEFQALGMELVLLITQMREQIITCRQGQDNDLENSPSACNIVTSIVGKPRGPTVAKQRPDEYC